MAHKWRDLQHKSTPEQMEQARDDLDRALALNAARVSLLDLIDPLPGGKIDYHDYCGLHGTCVNWEERVARPALQELGYTNIYFIDGERDSFGPLSRIACCEKNGIAKRFVYG